MPESRFSLETELPCMHCGTPLDDACQFCFECGAPVVPQLRLPDAPAGAAEELRTASFTPVSMRVREDDPGLQPGEPIEIESLRFDVVVDEIPIELDDDTEIDDGHAGAVADLHGTVVAMAPEHPMPFWPAPPKGDTVIAPPPTRPAP